MFPNSIIIKKIKSETSQKSKGATLNTRGRTAKTEAERRGWELGDERVGAGKRRGGSWETVWWEKIV